MTHPQHFPLNVDDTGHRHTKVVGNIDASFCEEEMQVSAVGFEIPQNDNIDSASLLSGQNPQNFKFSREDWTSFRSLSTLCQKAGVPANRLRRLVVKEIVDNALDTGANVTLRSEDACYIIEDDGPGLGGYPEDIARMFSIARPMESSKVWRLPTRGALGNGLRVVAGAVLSSGGTLVVTTRNQKHALVPQDDGTTAVISTPSDFPIGTRVEVAFGPSMPADPNALIWGKTAIAAAAGETYSGKSSPYWYDADSFWELLQAAGPRPVREFVERLDGCSGARAGEIASAFKARPCGSLDRGQAVQLMGACRSAAKNVSPRRLGAIGPNLDGQYAADSGMATIGFNSPKAEVPFVVEAWVRLASTTDDGASITVLTNRTPITADIRPYKEKKTISVYGCGLCNEFEAERGSYTIAVNIISPFIPIVTDGKEPDLSPFVGSIAAAVKKAIRKSKRDVPKRRSRSQKEIALANLEEAIAKASGDGQFTFNQRQLFYAVRPFIIDELGVEPTYGNFTSIITDYENEFGEIEGMHRDARGVIYHPHTGEEIPLGTKTVAGYRRPPWTFNKVLFIEKEGFFETLKATKWPERYDCALMSSKGFSSRAARDFLDMLAEDATEDVTVFCAHDADASGTMIYQTLQDETRARGRRKVEIINIGLEPWEAQEMGLAAEDRSGDKDAAVAKYIKDSPDGAQWAQWLQHHRYELNAMTMPQFIGWLDGKMADLGVEKVVPPYEVINEVLWNDTEFSVREAIKAEILAEANIDDRVASTMDSLSFPDEESVEDELPIWISENPTDRWMGWVDAKVEEITGGVS